MLFDEVRRRAPRELQEAIRAAVPQIVASELDPACRPIVTQPEPADPVDSAAGLRVHMNIGMRLAGTRSRGAS